MANELIKVEVKNDTQVVSARELYKGLEIAQRFSRWVSNNWDMFEEDVDFVPCTLSTQQNQYGGTKELSDYIITIDMAKQLAMMVRSERGKQYRKYFLELERKWNDPQEVVKRGYAILQNENAKLRIENQKMKPKALFADAVSTSNSSILIGQLAKILRQNGINIGQNRLFAWMRKNGYLGTRGSNRNVPTQRSMELGLFKTKETVINHSDGHTTVNITTKVTGKGQQYFINKFLSASVIEA
ncbi:oxidoreductase [Limosilactobacillus reuteri]|uniref:Oxidoreductase n=1 Tax=Limosilactobacillus reuteri TaxID=1598 RepID=A0A317GIS0_LIMRT|nr:phage antirepressor KilAC domain-containing protein [Limosilactobacillus reuteri]MCH5385758.1 phage antirepressor KilAC domain-containing protein [Limosilactobacillus reuteri]PWT46939.1 oxidoreductase [Limosilactobacillus reuteri]PWT51374.1 oxidoreductase [Limosilactobacillus reuteri]PWT62285.1 oxidoreductase [Limosilactobacillus reuteri]